MLTNHAMMEDGPAILGHPTRELATDPKFKVYLQAHVQAGELLAQAALQTELLICSVCDVNTTLYIGRSQYPMFQNKAICMKLPLDDKFTSPAANFWGVLGHMIDDYSQARSLLSSQGTVYSSSLVAKDVVVPERDQRPERGLRAEGAVFSGFSVEFKRTIFPLDRRIQKHVGHLLCHGVACTADQLKNHFSNAETLSDDWKGPMPNMLQTHTPHLDIACALADLHNQSDITLGEMCALCTDYKQRAIRYKCSLSSKDWRAFCLSQLSRNIGARVLHKFTNRQNAAPSVPLFKPMGLHVGPKTPNEASK